MALCCMIKALAAHVRGRLLRVCSVGSVFEVGTKPLIEV